VSWCVGHEEVFGGSVHISIAQDLSLLSAY
jgi:hypothetical protein